MAERKRECVLCGGPTEYNICQNEKCVMNQSKKPVIAKQGEVDFLGKHCASCDESRPSMLEIHHINPRGEKWVTDPKTGEMQRVQDPEWAKVGDRTVSKARKMTHEKYLQELNKCVLLCIKHHEDLTDLMPLQKGAADHTEEELQQMEEVYGDPDGKIGLMEDVGFYGQALTPESLIESYKGRPNWEQLKSDPGWLGYIEALTVKFGQVYNPETEGFDQLPDNDRRWVYKGAMERGLPNKDQRGMIERGDNSIQSSLAFAQELDGFYQDQMQGMTDSYEIDALKKARDEAIDLPIRHARQVAEVSKNASIGGNFNPSNPLFDEIWTPTMQKLDEGEAQFGLTPVQEPIIQPEQPIEPTQPTEEPAPAETGAEMPATPPAGAETPAAAPTEQPAPPPMPLGPGAEPQIPDRLQPPGVGEGQLHNQWEIKSEGPSPEEMQAMMAAQGAPPAGAPPGMPPATAKSLHDELKNRA